MQEISSELQLLMSTTVFQGLNPQDFMGMDLLWEIRKVRAEEVLWYQGQSASELAIVIRGALRAQINEQVLGRIDKGELVGELAVFTDDFRSATVVADKNDVTLLLLSKDGLRLLRDGHWLIYDRLLNSALNRLGNRIRLTNIEIAKKSKGTDDQVKAEEPTWLGSMFSKLPFSQEPTPPSAISALRKLPGLQSAHPMSVKSIMTAMTPKYFAKGKPIVLEGQTGDSAFLLVEGVIEVYRNVRGGKAQHLASLYPGALLGTGSLLLGERRNASCVASKNTAVWVYEISREQSNSLRDEPSMLWRESLLSALAFQLRSADELLVLIEQGQRPESDYDKVRRSLSGY